MFETDEDGTPKLYKSIPAYPYRMYIEKAGGVKVDFGSDSLEYLIQLAEDGLKFGLYLSAHIKQESLYE